MKRFIQLKETGKEDLSKGKVESTIWGDTADFKPITKLFHWVRMPDGRRIVINRIGRSLGFRKGRPVVYK